MRREGTKGRVWAVGGSDNNNIESREEGGVKKKHLQRFLGFVMSSVTQSA